MKLIMKIALILIFGGFLISCKNTNEKNEAKLSESIITSIEQIDVELDSLLNTITKLNEESSAKIGNLESQILELEERIHFLEENK